jgi:hypothetical protein
MNSDSWSNFEIKDGQDSFLTIDKQAKQVNIPKLKTNSIELSGR